MVCVGHAGPDQACDARAASAPGSAAGAPVRVQQVSLAPWVGGRGGEKEKDGILKSEVVAFHSPK